MKFCSFPLFDARVLRLVSKSARSAGIGLGRMGKKPLTAIVSEARASAKRRPELTAEIEVPLK
jgi:hypothetical protein